MKHWKFKLFTLIALFGLTFIMIGITSLVSEEENPGGKSSPELPLSSSKADSMSLNKDNAYPLTLNDYRIRVKEITYTRRAHLNGRGEVLDVIVEIYSTDSKTNEFSIYILAVNETKAIIKTKWRANDPKTAKNIINFVSLMPENFHPKEIWGDEEYKRREAAMQFQQDLGETKRMALFPSLDEYVTFLSKNRQKALKFKLYGKEGPVAAQVIESNMSIPAEEFDRDVIKSTNHNYTLQLSQFKTTITSHHYAEYRPDYSFYNRVLVILFDPVKEKNYVIYRTSVDTEKIKMVN